MQTGLLQLGFDAAIGEFRAQVGILQFVAPGLVQHRMISMQGCRNGKALVAGRGLNPGSAEWSSGKKFSVRDAVQGAAARHGKILNRNSSVKLVEQMKEHFFEALL